MRSEGGSGRKLLSPGPGGTALSGNGAINGNPWGIASFCALGGGARGSSEPTGQEEGSSVAGEEGGQLEPPEKRGLLLSPPQAPSSK